ncbi:MAG: trigger factor [Patescibacteria group bacterium]
MKTNFKKLPGSKIALEVSLDEKEFKNYWDAAYEHALASVNLKGFRPGTAPKEMAEQAIDKDRVFEEAAKAAVRFSLDEATQENNWVVIDTPKIDLKESPAGLQYKTEITILPEINLGNYQKIAKKIFGEKKEFSVDEKEVAESLEWLRNSRAKTIRANHEAHNGDVVEIDLESVSDGKPLDSFKNEKFILGQSHFIAGFDKELENHKEGENLNFLLTAPADYWKEELRDKKIDFKVRLNAIFDRQLPELNDEFAKNVGKFANLEELRLGIKDGIKNEKKIKERDRLRLKFLDEAIAESKMDVPDIMIEKTLEQMAENFNHLVSSGKKTEAQVKEELKPRARRNVEVNLLLYKIAEAEKIEFDPKGGIDNMKVFERLEGPSN